MPQRFVLSNASCRRAGTPVDPPGVRGLWLVCGLAIALLTLSVSRPAHSQCSPDTPISGDAVTCSGASTGFEAPGGVENLTVTIDNTATLDESDAVLNAAVGVNDNNTIDAQAGSTINVTETGGTGILAGDNNQMDIEATINVTADSAAGISFGGTTDPTSSAETIFETGGILNVIGSDSVGIEAIGDAVIRNRGEINVLGTNAIGVDMGDRSLFTSGIGSRLDVTGTNGIGVIGGLDTEIIWGEGELNIIVDGGRGIQIGGVSTDFLSRSTIFTNLGSTINVIGDNAIGIESTGDSTYAIGGEINLTGLNGRGFVIADRNNFSKANLMQMAGVINVGDGTAATTGGIGIIAGDGWYPNDIGGTDPNFNENRLGNGIIAIFQGGVVNVNSIDGFGIRVGNDANLIGNHNSVAFNGGTINVMATDAIGVSVGGNDFATPTDPLAPLPFTFRNDGSIIGTGDHGALVEFRDFSTGENRMINSFGASMLADAAFLGVPGGALAIVGTAGVERIENGGTMRGNVALGGGDDFFEFTEGGAYEGTLDGEAGFDTVIFQDNLGPVSTFDVSQLVNFELIRVGGGNGWSLENASGFTAPVQIDPLGRLVVVDPMTLGGDLVVDPTASLQLGVDPTTAALNVLGNATIAGTLIVDDPSAALEATTAPILLIDVAGVLTGTFADSQGPLGFEITATYSANEVFVSSNQLAGNRGAIARHLGQIDMDGGAEGELAELINNLQNSTTPIGGTLDSLGPEAYDAQTSVVVESGRQVTRMLFDRPRECRQGEIDPWAGVSKPLPCHGRKWSPWLATIGSVRSRDKYRGHPRYDSQIGGLVVGIDARPIEALDLTFAISSQRGSVDVAGAESSTLTMTDVSGHAAYNYGPLRVQSALSWGHGFHRDRRIFTYPDNFGNRTSATGHEDHDSDRITLGAEASLQIEAGPIQIEPIVTVDWAWVYQRPISESNAGLLGLQVEKRDDEVGSVSAGLRASTAYHHTAYLMERLEWLDGVWRPLVDVRWREVVTGSDRKIDARLVGAPAGVPGFTIEGLEDDGGIEVGAGLSFTPAEANRLQFDLRYEAFIASHTLEQDLTLRIQLGF